MERNDIFSDYENNQIDNHPVLQKLSIQNNTYSIAAQKERVLLYQYVEDFMNMLANNIL